MASGIHTGYNDVSGILTCLKNNGKTFVGRYIASYNNVATLLTKTEAQNISAAGLSVVTVYENSSVSGPNPTAAPYFTYSQGYSDGYDAFMQAANNLGQPSLTPVYFAADFDAVSNEQQAILDYFTGVRAGYNQYITDQRHYGDPANPYYIGVYGSYDVLTWCKTQGIANYFWQAFAGGWSSGRNANAWPGYNLRQRSGNASLCGFDVDDDDSNGAAGGWKI